MEAALSYTSIAVINFGPLHHVSLVTVSVTPEQCVLSGAWIYSDSDSSAISQVLRGHLLIVLGDRSRAEAILKGSLATEVTLAAFLQEAGREARNGLESFENFVEQNKRDYSAYMTIRPVDRKLLPKTVKKKLIQPNFYDWPEEIDLEQASEYFDSVRKLSKIQGTPAEMETVITASRLVKLMVDMWRSDEEQRNNRPYLEREVVGHALLPKVWLNQMARIN